MAREFRSDEMSLEMSPSIVEVRFLISEPSVELLLLLELLLEELRTPSPMREVLS